MSVECVLKKVGKKFLGTKSHSDVITKESGAKYQEIRLQVPGYSHFIPIHAYLPDRAMKRNRLIIICNKLDMGIAEFDRDCGFQAVSFDK